MTNLAAATQLIGEGLASARPRLPWVSADLQTLRNTLVSPKVDLSAWPAKTLTLGFPGSPDKTLCFAHMSNLASAKTIALIHGLGGDASGVGIAYLTKAFLEAGYHVVRINLRAAPMVYHLSSGISHAGKTDDLAAIFAGLDAALGRQTWLPIGISLGGNMLARALGDGSLSGFGIAAAMTICAPLDMKAASDRILDKRNWVYERHLLKDLQNAVLKTDMSAEWKHAAKGATTVYDFDDKVTGPFHGFGNAETYYAKASSGPFLKDITVPTLILHAADDPWIPAQSYAPFTPPPGHKVNMLITPRGGHVGFHFKGADSPAYCKAALDWFTAAAS